jgi:branched-chain amino acid transport system ATP-binding protein
MTLELKDVHVYYGDSHIVQGISLFVKEKEVVSFLGRNGVGKTTTLKSIMGLVPARRGSIKFNGEEISEAPPYKIAKKGIGYVPEDRRIFSDLTVKEHLNIALRSNTRSRIVNRIDDIYTFFPILKLRQTNRGSQLSGGEQQMLAIARALASNPTLLILDEPSEGLAPLIVATIKDVIMNIKKTGLGVLLTEHNIQMVIFLSDRYYIMEKGIIRHEGKAEQIHQEQDVIKKYLGV